MANENDPPDEGMNELPEKTYAEQFMEELLPDDAKYVRIVSVRDLALRDLIQQLKALTGRLAELEACILKPLDWKKVRPQRKEPTDG